MPVFALAGLVDNMTEMANELGDRRDTSQNALPAAHHHAAHNMNSHHPAFVAKTLTHRQTLGEVLHAGHPQGVFAGISSSPSYTHATRPGHSRGYTKGHFATPEGPM